MSSFEGALVNPDKKDEITTTVVVSDRVGKSGSAKR